MFGTGLDRPYFCVMGEWADLRFKHWLPVSGYACDFLVFMMSICRRFSILAKLTSGS